MLLNLSSNDYLGLAQHPAIIEAMREALLTEGAGSGASRLVTGNRLPYGRLEEALAVLAELRSIACFCKWLYGEF